MNEPFISPWLVYLFLKLETFLNVAEVFFAIGTFAFVLISIFTAAEIISSEPENMDTGEKMCFSARRFLKWTLPFVAAFLLFMPTQRDIVVIWASTKITPQMIQDAGNIADKAIDRLVNETIRIIEATKDSAKQKVEGE